MRKRGDGSRVGSRVVLHNLIKNELMNRKKYMEFGRLKILGRPKLRQKQDRKCPRYIDVHYLVLKKRAGPSDAKIRTAGAHGTLLYTTKS